MEFQNVPEETSTGRSNVPLEQLEKALDRGTSKRVGECDTFSSYGVDAIGNMIEKVTDLKIHGIPELQVSFTDSPLHEFSSSMNAFSQKGNGNVYEQTSSPFEISPGPDIPTRNVEEFQDYSKNRGFRPRSYSDRDVFSFPKRRNGRDFNDFHYEETKSKPGDIFNETTVAPGYSHFQEQRRPAFVKSTKNRNVMEGRDKRSYRKEKLHKTSSSSSAFSSKRNHMPVTRSKSFGGKPNDPFRVSYGSMDYHAKGGGVMTSLRRQALTNATSLSLATKNPVSYQEPTNELNQENKNGWRKPREDNRTQHQNLSRYGIHNRKSHHSLDFIGLLPVMDIPGIDTGEVIFCPPNGCKHIRITNCPWGSQNGKTKTLEFISPIPDAVDLDGGFFKTNKNRTNSLPDHPEDEADDFKFFEKFRDLESYWNRRHSSPLLRSQWSPTSPQSPIWQPSNEVNLSPFSLLPSHSAPCTPCHTPVSLKVPSLSDLANTESTCPAVYVSHGSVFFQNEEVFKKLEDIQQHHPALKRNVSDPPGCSTWHPLRSSLTSPLSQDIKSGKRFSYDGK